ncbi:MAG TPA: DUF1801 domain-containing protein [Chitinophagaceae bacterium]|nr:DUF1801 domain-containing protein [Chitinophagaceae bacterium]
MKKPKNTDEYISWFPEETRKILQQIRTTIKKTVPRAEETISYGIPTFNLNGSYLIYFAGYKNHVSIYPAPRGKDEFKQILAPYKGGKGTVQFPLDQPIPFNLIVKIVKFRMKENSAEAEKKIRKAAGKNYIKYHNDGSIWAKGKMSGDSPDGYWEWFRKGGGAIMRSGYFNKGKQTGEWTTYDKNGKVYKVTRIK